MITVWNLYIIILAYFLLGTIGIYLINRKNEADVRRRAWIKHLTYFIITNILFFSIPFNTLYFRIIAALIIIMGFLELFKLFRESEYDHFRFYITGTAVMALFSVGLICFSRLESGVIMFSFLILSVFDGFSQITGQLFGRTRLFPRVSPDKTVEGLVGGTIVALLSSLVFRQVIPASPVNAFLLALVAVIFAFAGDALKSIYKRRYKVKNFSSLLPGHGGFLDRFDSLIATGAGVALANFFFHFRYL